MPIEQADANAGGAPVAYPRTAGRQHQQVRLGKGLPQLLGNPASMGSSSLTPLVQVFQHHHKLIAPQTGHRIRFAHTDHQTPRRFHQ